MALTLPYADDYRSHGSLPKPTKFDRQAAKAARKTLIAKVKLKEQRQAMKVYADFRKRIYARDGGLCRAYGEPLKLLTDNVLTLAHVHHITFKSAGGADTLENCCLLSPKAHALVHAHLLHVEGNAQVSLSFTLTDGSGAVLERWVSEGGR